MIIALLLAASSAGAVTGGGDVVFKAEGMGDSLFSHEFHVNTAKKRCSACHYAIYTNKAQHKTVGMAGMEKGKSCGACHDGKQAFSVSDKKLCEKCHISGGTKY